MCRLLPYLSALGQARAADSDPSPALALPLQRNLHIPLAQKARKFLSPFDQQNTVPIPQIVESERLQFARSIYAIQINVKKISLRAAILVHQRKGRTGDVFLGSRFKRSRDPLDQRGFSCAQIAAQQHKFRRCQQFRQRASKGDCFFSGFGGEFSRHRNWPRAAAPSSIQQSPINQTAINERGTVKPDQYSESARPSRWWRSSCSTRFRVWRTRLISGRANSGPPRAPKTNAGGGCHRPQARQNGRPAECRPWSCASRSGFPPCRAPARIASETRLRQ